MKTKANIFWRACRDKNKHLRDRTKSACAIHTSVFQGEWHYTEVPFSLQDILRSVTLVPIVSACWWLLLTPTTAANPLCSDLLLNSVPWQTQQLFEKGRALNLLQLPRGDLKKAEKMQQPYPSPGYRSRGEADFSCRQEEPNLRAGQPWHWENWAFNVCSTCWLQLLMTVLPHLFCIFGTGLTPLCFYLLENWFWKSVITLKLILLGRTYVLFAVLLHICAHISAGKGSDHVAKAEMWEELLEQSKRWMSCYVKHILTKDIFTLNPISPHSQTDPVIVCVHSKAKDALQSYSFRIVCPWPRSIGISRTGKHPAQTLHFFCYLSCNE